MGRLLLRSLWRNCKVAVSESREINGIDQFAGAGGTSTGFALACRDLSLKPRLTALNHWDVALETHKLNHPWARHILQDIRKVDPVDAAGGRPISLLTTSPQCIYHSNARGGKPVNDQERQAAFVAVHWIRVLRPVSVLMENVPEFVNYGPLLPNDKPDPARKGWTFRRLVGEIKACGYEVAWRRDINAADFGDATTRTRFFLIARRDGQPLTWPEPSHSKDGVGGKKPWKAAIEVIDRSLVGRSLFSPGARPLARPTWIRITYGLYAYGCEEVDPLVDQLAKQLSFTDDMKRRALKRRAEYRKRRFPRGFTLSMASGGVAREVGSPLPTAVGKGAGHVAEPLLMTLDRPLTNRCRARPISSPMFTSVGAHERQGLFEPMIVPPRGIMGGEYSNIPRAAGGPFATFTQRGGGHLVQPFVYTMEHGGRTIDPDRPINTLTTAKGGAHAIVEPDLFTVGVCGRNLTPRPVDEPYPTLIAARSTRWLIEPRPFVTPQFGERDGQDPRTLDLTELPMWSATSHGAGSYVDPFLVRYASHDWTGQENTVPVQQPLPTATTRDRLAIVMPVIDDVGLDILYRMIQPHETAAAMSFPPGYKFAGNRGEVVKQIGNAVAVETARALCRSLMQLPKGMSLDDFAA